MKRSRLLGAVCACLTSIISFTVHAVAVSGQGTWETTLLARDFDGDTSTIEGYYDTVLNITWLADANAGAGSAFDDGLSSTDGEMTWANANAWAASLIIDGASNWRLPTMSAVINGGSFDLDTFSTNGTSDTGYAPTTTDGTDGGWRDGLGNPASEMGHMYYVTLGNFGYCPPDGGDGDPSTCDGGGQPGWGLSNIGPFQNVQSTAYWFDTERLIPSGVAKRFDFHLGQQSEINKNFDHFVWAVHSGDIGTAVIPIPPALWLFGSGLLGLIGMARRRAS